MKRLILCGLSLFGLALAVWGSNSSQSVTTNDTIDAVVISRHFGAIQPQISPDGARLAFSYQGEIWHIARTGGTMTRVTDGAGFDIEPVWSPDAALIA